MTLGDVLAALGAPRRIAARRRLPPAAGRRSVTGVAYDSRRVDAGLAVRRAARAEGRRRRVRGAGGRARRGRDRRRSAAPDRHRACRGSWSPTRGSRWRVLADRVLRPPEPPADGRRRHRHQRQDDDRVSARVDLRGGRACRAACSARSSTASATEDREATRTTPEAPDVQRMFRRDGLERAAAPR